MRNVILVGNPNTGKTTLFNTLTKKNNRVGNWHGVTTDVSQTKIKKTAKIDYNICDLPGIYSLFAYSEEEKIAIDYLFAHKDDEIFCIVDANNLKRNLLLALELIENKFNVTIVVNMFNENKFDIEKLSKLLGVKVIAVDARKRKDAAKVLESDLFVCGNKLPYLNHITDDIENNISIRFNYIDLCLKNINIKEKNYGTSKLDKFLYNKALAPIIFLFVMFIVFAITFGHIGQFFSELLSDLFDWCSAFINNFLIKLNITAWAHSLIINGVVAGVGIVISFLPQVVLLNVCMNFLENIGYLPRVAYMFDGKLKKIGLTGKSIFSILLGFGCTTSALLTTKALDNIKLKKQTALVMPFASCNAKLPIFLLISSVFFEKYKVFAVFLLYIVGVVLGIFVSYISFKISKREPERFFLEIPKIRVPDFKNTIKNAFCSAREFIRRVGTTLVFCSIIIWVLINVSFSFKYVNDVSNSILYKTAKFITPIFNPIGLNNWGLVVALLVGLSAKEMIVSCLAIANGITGNMQLLSQSLRNPLSNVCLNPASAISFLVFVLLYTPCVSAISVMAKEISKKFAVFVFCFQFAVAYVISFISYRLSNLILGGRVIEFILLLFVLAIICVIMLKWARRKRCLNCKGECYGRICDKGRM